ncbi:hypothetical protein GCM10027289_17710 [Tsukamurella serpentis]
MTTTDCEDKNPQRFDTAPTKIITSNNAGADLLARIGAGPQVTGLGWARGLDSLAPDVRQSLSSAQRLSDGNIDKEKLLSSGAQVFLATFASMEMMGTPEPTDAEYRAANLTKVFIKSSACAKFLPGPRTDLEQVYSDITGLADLTGHRQKGADLVASMKKRIDDARARIPANAAKPSVFHFDVAASKDTLTTPGNRQIANAVYTLAGTNPLGGKIDRAFGKFTYEELVAANPDWITIAVRRTGDEATVRAAQDAAIAALAADPRTQNLTAVREKRFIRTTSEDMTLAGPANADQVAAIIDTVNAPR